MRLSNDGKFKELNLPGVILEPNNINKPTPEHKYVAYKDGNVDNLSLLLENIDIYEYID